jgi:thiol:disulfide interchange protein DsbC
MKSPKSHKVSSRGPAARQVCRAARLLEQTLRLPRILVAACLVLWHAAGADPGDEARLLDVLAQLDVRRSPEQLAPAPIPGFLEIVRGLQVLYVSADGRMLIDGDILSVATETNLTERTRSVQRHRMLDEIPRGERIVLPAVAPKRAEIVVFADTNCPYCLKLHAESSRLRERGIEIQYLFYPRSGPGSASFGQAVSVWCAADRVAALGAVLAGGSLPAADCPNPVMRHYQLALELDLKGTPAILTADGGISYGVPGVDELLGVAAQP